MSSLASLPPWRSVLRGAREREGKRSALGRWLQLATVAPDGTPRVRTVVFRGWAGAALLDVLTDGRSAKMAELSHQSVGEICWLLPRARVQFRLRGPLAVLPQAEEQRERFRYWRALSPEARALWDSPGPGLPLDLEDPMADNLSDGAPMPMHFVLLRFALLHVEALELMVHPHRRRRWRLETGWAEEPLHP
jgi:pyridoxamine 5'-phosphate oxidase